MKVSPFLDVDVKENGIKESLTPSLTSNSTSLSDVFSNIVNKMNCDGFWIDWASRVLNSELFSDLKSPATFIQEFNVACWLSDSLSRGNVRIKF